MNRQMTIPWLSHSIALGLVVTTAFGQTPATTAATDAAAELEEVVVTGTNVARQGFNTPLSVSRLNSEAIERVTFNSQADILATLPGVKAEGGGGEVAVNFQVRGLPSSGQYQFTPLEYNGMPVLSTFGLNSSAYDVYARNDLGVERLEFVQGGVSNLFGPGSVAGIVNYIDRSGGMETEGALQLELAEDGRYRSDFALSGPLNDNNFFALSGFYRYDEGPLDSNLTTEGFQVRGNYKHVFADGAGTATVYAQYIDDRVQFFLPLPLGGTSQKRIAGNDSRTVFTVNTRAVSGLTSILPTGERFNSPIEDGVSTSGGFIGLVLDRELDNGVKLDIKTKWADYRHQFNLFLDGDGIINIPESQQTYLANRNLGLPATAQFTFVDSGQALPANFLLFANRVLNRDRPVTDYSGEVNLSKTFNTGTADHNVTIGGWVARAEAGDFNVTQTYLAEFNNAPRLVNLVANGVEQTRNGLLQASSGYANNVHSALRTAIYAADQIDGDRWAFDFGVRVERLKGELSRERATAFTGISQGGANESATLQTSVFGNGSFLLGEVTTTEWAAAVGALYRLSDQLNLYGNVSRGFFFPEVRSVAFNALGDPASYEGEIVKQIEAGIKLNIGRVNATLAAFFSDLDNRRSVTFQNTPGGGIAEVVTQLSTEAIGVEGTWGVELADNFAFSGNVTYTDHEVSDSTSNPAIVGNELERKPNVFANAGFYYDNGRFDVGASWNYQSSAFANNANTVELDAYNLVRFDAGYTHEMSNDDSIRVGLSVFNVTDSEGLAEGSPRVGDAQVGGGAFFVGRPILPRRYSVRFEYKF